MNEFLLVPGAIGKVPAIGEDDKIGTPELLLGTHPLVDAGGAGTGIDNENPVLS